MTSTVPPVPQPPEKSSKKGIWIALAVALVLIIAGGGVFAFTQSSESSEGEGEIFLEAAASPGEAPFTPPMAGTPDPTIAEAATLPPPNGASGTTTAQAGGTPGLYGGTTKDDQCDPEKLIAFLESNPDKATAWLEALNSDPTLQWSGGNKVTQGDIRAYVNELTPIVLVADTRVTNHGFKSGRPTAFQSVLQRGSSVLIDKYGVPRVRCFCGNPLKAPIPSKSKPTYKGKAWPGFSAATVQVVVSSPQPVTSFQVRVPATPGGTLVTVKVGSRPATKPTPTPAPTASPTPSPTTPAAPTPSATTPAAPTPSAKGGSISVAAVKTHPNGDVDYSVTLTGYSPNAKVSLKCASSAQPGGFYDETVTTDASGAFFASPFCYTRDPGFVVTDNFGGSS